MEREIHIEVLAEEGIEGVRPFLSLMPIEIMLETTASGVACLRQKGVSQIAGFYLHDIKESLHLYGASFDLNVEVGSKLVAQISDVFKRAELPHKIVEIFADIDSESELISYRWQ